MTLKKDTNKLIKTGNAAEVTTVGFYVQTVNHQIRKDKIY